MEQQKLQLPKPTCSNKQKIKLVCSDLACHQPSFMCIQQQCPCQLNHLNCHISFYQKINQLLSFEKKIPPQSVQKSYNAIQKQIDQMIDQLSIIKQDLHLAKQYYGKGKYQRQFFDYIVNGQYQQITGNLIYQLEKQNKTWKQPEILTAQQIEKAWILKKNEFNKLTTYFTNLLSRQSKPFASLNDQSRISAQFNQIAQWIQIQTKSPFLHLQLLYRASENNFQTSIYHKKCNGIPNLLCIIQSQHGNIFGGFNPNAMYPSTSDSWINDNTGKAFIFSLDDKQCYPIKDKNYSYCCNQTYGPTFGNVDFYICDKSNTTGSSYGNFPKSYGMASINKSYKDLFGGGNTNFKTKEWQVYKVNFL